MSTKLEFAVTPPQFALVWLIPGVSLLAALIATILALRQSGQAWTALAILLPIAALVVYSIQRRKVVLENGVLRVAAGPHTAKVPVASIDLDAARVVDLDEHKEFRPGLRSFGVGTPGLKAGHFKTFGGQRSFVLLTDRRRVLLLPERSGRHLLLSVEKPHVLLDALHAANR
jgi:heme exporter protein D